MSTDPEQIYKIHIFILPLAQLVKATYLSFKKIIEDFNPGIGIMLNLKIGRVHQIL